MTSKKYVKLFYIVIYLQSAHRLSTGGLSLLPNFQKEGLTGSQFLQEGCWKRGDDIFQQEEGGEGGWLQFLHKKETNI